MISAAEIAEAYRHLTPEEQRELDALLQQDGPPASLLKFVPTIHPKYTEPRHLQPLVAELERSWTESVRITACAPPRHAKTETTLAFAILTLLRDPTKTVAYVTYEAHTAQSKSRKARQYAIAAGLSLAPDAQRSGEWRTPQGGGFIATGIGGPLTSQGVDLLLIDDPYKNRVQAESAAYRRMVTEWVDDVAETRIEPGGSAFIFHTRWHSDDLISYVHKKGGWKHVHMPAISADGKALWPDRWPLDALETKRQAVGEYTWASLYQGVPRSRDGQLFRDVTYYDALPTTYSAAIGVDLAYTAKTQADHSIAVVLYEHHGYWYVADVIRKQVQAPAFSADLKALATRYPGAGMRWYCSGVELGSADFIRRDGVPLSARTTTSDKYIRAQPVAAMWNAGRVLVPRQAPWLEDFARVITGFTGVNDSEDDDVDALAAAFDQLPATQAPAPRPKPGTPEWAAQEEERLLQHLVTQQQQRLEEEAWGDGYGWDGW